MPINLLARSFWLAGEVKALRMGDRVIRFTATNALASISTVNTATVSKRLGATNAAKVLNRFVWVDTFETGSDMILAFTNNEAVDATYALNSTADPLLRTAASNPISDGDYWAYELAAIRMACRGLAQPLWGAPLYRGMMAASEGLSARPIAIDCSLLALAGGHNVDVQNYSGTPAFIRGLLKTGGPSNIATSWGYLLRNGLGGTTWDLQRDATAGLTTNTTYHPRETDVRSIFSQASGTLWTGKTSLAYAKAAAYVRAGWIHGIHSAIKAIVLDADGAMKYIYAGFTAGEIADIIDQQATLHDDPVSTQLTNLATQVRSQGNTRFSFLASAAAMGPYDIYTMKKIQKALADGASMSDVNEHVVGGKRLDVWRAECNALPGGQKAWLWPLDRGGVLTSPQVTITGSAPWFTVDGTTPGGSYHVADNMCAYIVGVSSGLYANSAAVRQAMATTYEATFVDDTALDQSYLATGVEVPRPWEDLPETWLRRATMHGAQPVANVLLAALTEPAALFGYDPLP